MSAVIKPFRIAVGDDVLDDLRLRLRNTRWPEAELVDDWSQGAPLKWIQEMCRYWAEDYDWRGREALLNRFPQFTTEIDGLDIHFIHARSPHPQATPLVITHGWPGSVVEFHKAIEPLTDPTAHGGAAEDAFHVVCPSLPGFGFSAKPAGAGWGVDRIASAWTALMGRLGYARYGAQGGDWGSAVTTSIGAQDPDHCLGIHITLAMGDPRVRTDRLAFGSGRLDPREILGVDGLRRAPGKHPQSRRTARQRHAVLGDCDRSVVRPALLGKLRTRTAGSPPGSRSDRGRGVSRGDRSAGAALDGGHLHQYPPLERNAERRPLRRLRAA